MITIGGLPGTGTTTVARMICVDLGLRHVYVGKIFREMAAERGMTVEEFNAHVEGDPGIDEQLDLRQIELARGGGIVLEGRMSCMMLGKAGIPAYDVWLTAERGERARRISEREGLPRDEVLERMVAREESERRRYVGLYGFDTFDLAAIADGFDVVIDTTHVPARTVADMVLEEYARWSVGR